MAAFLAHVWRPHVGLGGAISWMALDEIEGQGQMQAKGHAM